MADAHRIPPIAVRPEPSEVEAARPHLGDRTLEAFLRAALRALAAEPERTLDLLAPHWPPPRRRGRPRKSAPPTDAGGAREQ